MLKDIQSMEFIHDLKTPLQLISSCVELLQGELGEDCAAGDYLRMLARSADQLRSMVRTALEGESAERGLRDVVRDAREIAGEFDLLARRRGLRVRFSSNAASFRMRTDGEKLRRILHNLLSNALRFTAPGGMIRLEALLLGDAVEFSVADSGCGIPADRQAQLFERGFSTDSTGHGLCIARKYASILGGSLKLRSRPGCGSRFTLRIPVENRDRRGAYPLHEEGCYALRCDRRGYALCAPQPHADGIRQGSDGLSSGEGQ